MCKHVESQKEKIWNIKDFIEKQNRRTKGIKYQDNFIQHSYLTQHKKGFGASLFLYVYKNKTENVPPPKIAGNIYNISINELRS